MIKIRKVIISGMNWNRQTANREQWQKEGETLVSNDEYKGT